jgi:AcrR family transcriptional regulator
VSDQVRTSHVASSIKDADALAAGRERLLRGARECFSKRGYGATSVQDIATAAGISVGSLYKYVRAKEDLLWLMAERSSDRLQAVVDDCFARAQDPAETLPNVVDALVRNADADRDLMTLLYAEFTYLPREGRRLIVDLERSIVVRLKELIEHGNALGSFRCDDPQLAAIDIETFGSVWVLKSHMIGLTIDEYIHRQTNLALVIVGAVESTPVPSVA